jgi:hypothetical protein
MELSRFYRLEKRDFMHIAIGGAICFFVMFLLSGFAYPGLEQTLIYFGVIGVVIFEESYTFAVAIFLFGVIYLTAGFCGGLYTGYNIEENLKTVLVIPGIIGFAAFTFLLYLSGNLVPSTTSLISNVFLPLLGNVIGSYLGGYAMNWPSEEEEEDFEEFEI